MLLPNIRNEFLGCTTAINIKNNEQLEEFKHFLGVENLYTKDGRTASSITCTQLPMTFYRDSVGMYIDYTSEVKVRALNYKVCNYENAIKIETQPQQMNFFGGEEAPGIKRPDESLLADDPMSDGPIEAEAKVVEDELSLDVILDYATVGTITPAECDGLILENKDKVIDFVKKYDNIVVTKENYNELKEDVVAKFKDKIKALKEENTRFNKEVTKNVKPFSEANLEVRKAIESVLNPLVEHIEEFEKEEIEKRKNKLFDETIKPTLDIMVANGIIDEETRKEFSFNPKWTNASARTKTGNLTKKTTDEINAELNRLGEMYAQKQRDIETIKSTVETLATAHNVDKEALKADTYIDLYNRGVDMPNVQQRINADLENTKRAVERAKEKTRIKAEQKQRETQRAQNVQQVQNTMKEEKTIESNYQQEEVFNLADENTGEVVAMANGNKIVAKRIDTPDQLKDKTYTYTYEFSGDFGAIKTFSNVLKILSKISNFKYTRK